MALNSSGELIGMWLIDMWLIDMWRVLAAEKAVQYPVFMSKMRKKGKSKSFHAVIPGDLKKSGYLWPKSAYNTRGAGIEGKCNTAGAGKKRK